MAKRVFKTSEGARKYSSKFIREGKVVSTEYNKNKGTYTVSVRNSW